MKKFLMFLLVMVFSISLVGCEFLPEDLVEQASEELCREDPDNPLCEIDNVSDIENEVVLELFNQVRNYYTNDELNSYCETLFSSASVDLLDRCRTEESMLFPDDIEEYEVEEIVNEESYYKIRLVNKETNQTFDFQLVIDGESIEDYKIGKWSFEEQMLETVSDEMLIEEVGAFLRAYENPNLPDEEVCSAWLGEDEDCDDALTKNRVKFKAGAELSKSIYLDPDSDGDGIEDLTVEYDFDGHVTVLKLRVQVSMLDQETSLTIESIQVEHALKEDVLTSLHSFVSDFSDTSLTNEEVCQSWVGEDEDCDDALADNRVKFKAGAELSKSIAITNPDLDGDGWVDVAVSYEFRGHVTVLKISIQPNSNEETLALQIKTHGVETILQEETANEFDAFIGDLKNEEISPSEVCRVWVDGVDDDCDGILSEARSKFKAGAELSKTVYGGDPDSDGDGLFDGVLEFKNDDSYTRLDLTFRETVGADTRSIVITSLALFDGGGDCDDQGCPIYPGMVKDLYTEYINLYNNEETSKEELDALFLEPLSEEFYLERERLLSSGMELEFVALVGPIDQDTYIVVYDIIDVITSRGDSRQETQIKIKPLDKASPLIIEAILDPDDDDDGLPTVDEVMFIQDFERDLKDETMPLMDVCKAYLGTMETCPIIEEDEQVVDVSLLETGAGILLRIKKRPDLLTSDWDYSMDTYRVYFYTNLDGQQVFDLVPTLDFSYEEEVTKEFQQVLDGLANEDIPLDEVCAPLSNESQVVCVDVREQLVNMNPTIVGSKTVYIEEEEYIELSVEYGSSDVSRMTFRVMLTREGDSLHQVLDFTIIE